MLCEEIMKKKVESVGQDEAVLVAADKMRKANVGFLPVCDDDGNVVGTLTDRDIAIRLVAENLPAKTLVRNVMTNDVVACRPNDDVHYCEELMATKQVSRIVCCDERGKLQGVISLSDIAEWESDRAVDTLRRVSAREAHAHAA